MAKKNRATMTAAERKAFDKRSAQNKRGWDTRRKKAIAKAAALLEHVPHIGKKKRKPKPKFDVDKLSRAQLKAKVEQLEAEKLKIERELAAELETKGFVDTRGSEFLHPDGTIAVHPCRLRHVDEAKRLRKALVDARRRSVKQFDAMARDMAEFYDLPVREVYTLFWSP